MTYHETLLRQFLLGRLDESDRNELERDLLENDSLFEQVDSIDAEMIFDLARGKLGSDDAEALRTRLFASDSGRREWSFYRLLSAKLMAMKPAAARPLAKLWQSRTAIGLLAAVLAVAICVPLFQASQDAIVAENRRLASQLAELREVAGSAPLRVTFALSPLTRSNDQAEQVTIGAETEFVGLWLEPTYQDGPFRALVSQRGEQILVQELTPLERDWGIVLPLELTANTVAEGVIEVVLERFDGDWVPVDSYSVDFTRK